MPVVFPVHPRTRAALGDRAGSLPAGLHAARTRVGYLDFLSLEADARAVLTDSGGIQEETTYLGVPCFTLRDNTERPITIEQGTNHLLGLDPARIAEVPGLRRRAGERARVPPPLWDGHAAERLAAVVTDVHGRLINPPFAGDSPGPDERRERRSCDIADPMVSLSFAPKDRVFFDLLTEAGQNAVRASGLLQEMLQKWPDGAEGMNREILKAEQEGDRITHDIIKRLNSTFVTPFDREDIYGLATQVDDVVDYIEEAADFLGLYQIEAPMEQSFAFADVLVGCCEELATALARAAWLQGPRPRTLIEIHRLENDGDRISPRRRRVALRERHRPDGRDPLEGHLRRARARHRRDRDRRPHHRGRRDQERLIDVARQRSREAGGGDVDGDIVLVIVIATALVFDFTNGFHDTANVVATSISTHAMSPRVAVGMASLLNFAGAFISIEVAATIASDVVQAGAITPTVIFAGLVGAIAWNLITWYFGLPSSSSHALIGGVVGAVVAAVGTSAVIGEGIVGKVLIPAVVAPIVAFIIGVIAIVVAYRICGKLRRAR